MANTSPGDHADATMSGDVEMVSPEQAGAVHPAPASPSRRVKKRKLCVHEGCSKQAQWPSDSCRAHDGGRRCEGAVMANTSPGDHANATMSGETTDIRTGSSDSDDHSTVATSSKSIRAPMDTLNSDEHPNEKQKNEEEEVAHGEGERVCCGLLRGQYTQLKGEYYYLKGEYEKLRLLLQKPHVHTHDEVNNATH